MEDIDTQPFMIDEVEEQVYDIGEKLQVRLFVQEGLKFFQLTRRDRATGEFAGITLDHGQYEKLRYNFKYLIAKLADVDKRGEKVMVKVDLGDDTIASINWRFPGIDLRLFWTSKEGEQKATRRGIHYSSVEFNKLCDILSQM